MTALSDFPHQSSLFDATKDVRGWAVFFEQGLGKTRPVIQTARHLHSLQKVDAVVVLAPNGVHRNWVTDELPRHCEGRYRAAVFDSSRAGTRQHDAAVAALLPPGTLPFLCLTYEGLMTRRGLDAVHALCQITWSGPRRRFVAGRPFLLVADETSRVKNHTAKRTKATREVAELAAYVRILNGTPVGNSPLDVYAQMLLLDAHYWERHGFASYTAFKARFAITKKISIGASAPAATLTDVDLVGADADAVDAYEAGVEVERTLEEVCGVDPAAPAPASHGRSVEVVVGYRDLEKIHQMLAPSSTRLTKADSGLQMPERLYSRLPYELTRQQRAAYDKLRNEYMVELDDGRLLTATQPMVRVLRLHQIACGYLPDPDDPDEPATLLTKDGDPRLDVLGELCEDTPGPMLVWHRFRLDGDRIAAMLGKRCVRYDGSVTSTKQRAAAIAAFKAGDAQFFVANPAAIGMGVSLPSAKTVAYYSNSFSLVDRLQSADRAHRLNSSMEPVIYYDVTALRTVDEKIIQSLREDKDVAAQVQGDTLRAWLT